MTNLRDVVLGMDLPAMKGMDFDGLTPQELRKYSRDLSEAGAMLLVVASLMERGEWPDKRQARLN